MKRPFVLVTVGLMVFVTALASPIGKAIGEQLDVQIRPRDEYIGRPRTSPLFTAILNSDWNYLSVSSLYNVGEVDIVIENLTTGEYSEDSFNSSFTAFFPISGNAGHWTILLTLESGECFMGEFEL